MFSLWFALSLSLSLSLSFLSSLSFYCTLFGGLPALPRTLALECDSDSAIWRCFLFMYRHCDCFSIRFMMFWASGSAWEAFEAAWGIRGGNLGTFKACWRRHGGSEENEE